jgi:hypothetical protein
MTTIGAFRSLDLVTFYPKEYERQLTEVVVETYQKDVQFSSGYAGDNSEKDLATDFTDKLDIPEMVAKCWTNEDRTVLKAVAVFSKHRVPFDVIVRFKHIPPADEALNRKYLDVLDGSEGLQHTYELLKQNPGECPMVPADEVLKRFGYCRILPQNDLVDLRREINYRFEMPFGCGTI